MSARLSLTSTMIITSIWAQQLIADDEKTATSVTRSEVESLLKRYADSQQEFKDALAKVKTREERERVRELLRPKPVPNATRFIEWAELKSMDDLVADVLALIVVHGGKTQPATRAAHLLAKDHIDIDSERFFKLAPYVFNTLSPKEAEIWMRVFAENGSSRQTQALAYLLLAKFKTGLVRYAQLLGNPQFAEEIEIRTDKDLLEHLENLDVAKTNAEAELLFEQLITEFPDVKSRGINLANAARPAYFAVSKLAIGKTAPEIDGQDLEGEPMELSAYRGKVVVLCFWGTWCAPCMKMVPHHNDLVARNKDAPFAFLGVATDRDREKLDATIASQGITWRNWWDGGETGNSISRDWSIDHWPSIFVLDHNGIIRHKHLYGEKLDAAVSVLLKDITESKPR